MLQNAKVPVSRQIALIHDASTVEHGMSLATALGLEAICLRQLSPAAKFDSTDFIIDVDVHDLATVEALRRVLSRSADTTRRVFLIAGGRRNRAGKVQAEALGATKILEREGAEKELLRAQTVPRLGLPGPSTAARLSTTAEGRSIAAAGEELAKLFDCILGDQPIDMASLTSASEQILGGIEEFGTGAWLATVRHHHEGTFQHCLLVAGVAASYADRTNMGKVPTVALLNAAMLHDIGKALVPITILDKPSRLDDSEMASIKRHPTAAYDYLVQQREMPKVVLDAVRHHHEFLDGSGYPDGLIGKAIQPLTRILTVCDIFAALTEERPYKQTRTPAEAIGTLSEMVRRGKVDANAVRNLAQSFDIWIPETDLTVDEARPYLRQ